MLDHFNDHRDIDPDRYADHTATVLLDGIADFNDPSIGRDDAPDDGDASGLRAVGPSCGSLDNRRTRDVETGATAPSHK